MTAALERIEERLDRLEATPISTDNTPLENVSINYKYLCGRNNECESVRSKVVSIDKSRFDRRQESVRWKIVTTA